jgi:hypothetical protein
MQPGSERRLLRENSASKQHTRHGKYWLHDLRRAVTDPNRKEGEVLVV